MGSILRIIVIVNICLISVHAFDYAVTLRKLTNDVKREYCTLMECCKAENVPYNLERLKNQFNERLFGQHIVNYEVFSAISNHYKNIKNSKKPLVLSFHGAAGVGKSFVGNIIVENVFEKGLDSKFYHIFHGVSDFPGKHNIDHHKEVLEQKIMAAVKSCEYAIIIFDECDKVFPGVIDVMTSILDHQTKYKGLSFVKAIFIFISNDGGEDISKVLNNLEEKGTKRENTKQTHFQTVIEDGAYYRKGGFQNSRAIDNAVIDYFIPFLPLEEKHVRQCIRAEFKENGHNDVSENAVNNVLDYIAFDAKKKFAKSGCKQITKKVRTEL
ncbi:unnamed protein product [Diamesa tonsa]